MLPLYKLSIALHHCWCLLWCHKGSSYPHWVLSSRDLLHGSRKLSGSRLVPHLLGNVDSLIKSDTPRCSMFFCLFLSLGDSLGALMVRQRTAPHLDLSALSSQCQCDQTFPTVVALAISSLTFFWTQTLTYPGGQGRCGTNLVLSAPQVNDFDLIGDFDLIRCHGRALWVRWAQIWDDRRQCTTASPEPKANKRESFANLLRYEAVGFLPLISHWLESLGVKMAFLPLFVDFVVFVVAEISYGLKLDLEACFIFSAL